MLVFGCYHVLKGGWPGLGKLVFVGIRIAERISLRHFSGKYRDAEGAPGSFFEPGSWGGCSFRGVRDASRAEALLRQRPSAFYYLQLLSAATAVEDGARERCVLERVGERA